ncbi:MAG: alpha-D-ribose 1-methylphosphonate 5-phosphate C-P-lyase PhnJ, partial [Acidobacteria bacterium]|nr:alpha-D-ribose 1-methylphosphonate 5-phosphate C-P-lyase PhnJ [Acidobacteriota bacterium]
MTPTPRHDAAPASGWRDSLPSAAGGYSFGFLDEGAKREIRRKTLKAVAIPGHQVPFGSREMPIAR